MSRGSWGGAVRRRNTTAGRGGGAVDPRELLRLETDGVVAEALAGEFRPELGVDRGFAGDGEPAGSTGGEVALGKGEG